MAFFKKAKDQTGPIYELLRECELSNEKTFSVYTDGDSVFVLPKKNFDRAFYPISPDVGNYRLKLRQIRIDDFEISCKAYNLLRVYINRKIKLPKGNCKTSKKH